MNKAIWSESDQQLIVQHLDKLPAKCPVCGSEAREIDQSIVVLPVAASPGSGIGCVSVYCTVCGAQMLFQAETLGLKPA